MTRQPKPFLTHWLPVIAYCLMIFLQSARPAPENLPEIAHLDKLLHAGAYAVLSALFFRAFETLPIKEHIGLIASLSILSASLYGIGDELHQSFVPHRNADIADAVADMAGSVLGAYLYWAHGFKKGSGIRKYPD